jgi:hypothetical protein
MQTKEELISAFKEASSTLHDFIRDQPQDVFEFQPGGKWSAGQHLDHMIRSVKPLNLAYRMPRLGLQILFGKPNRPARNYKELTDRYNLKLAGGAVATGAFVPPTIKFHQKQKLLKNFARQNEKLCSALFACKEDNLDKYLLPHPLLGKITLREMMFFTIYHNQHHLDILKNRKE